MKKEQTQGLLFFRCLLILTSNKNLQFAPAEIVPYCVVVLGGRQPACVLRLVWRDFCSLLG